MGGNMKRRTFIKTVLISPSALIFWPRNLIVSASDINTIKILMLYNNMGKKADFKSKWGLSMWIENNQTAILFDTGGKPSTLWKNVSTAAVDIQKLSTIIISHHHYDHVGGLPIILEKTNYRPEVYVPEANLKFIKHKNPKAKVTGITGPIQINDYLWSTGQHRCSTDFDTVHEQSLIIYQNGSMYLLTGCSHPGIDKIVKKAKQIYPDKKLNLIIGGFHMPNYSYNQVKKISDELKRLQVKKIGPSHCTGGRTISILKKEWKENFIDFCLGNSMIV